MSIKLFGHPVHPMLVGFPIGMLGGSVVFDVVYLITGEGRWADISFWMMGAGVIAGLMAAPFGTIDWLEIPVATRAKRVGLLHGVAAVVSVALFAASWFFRFETPEIPGQTAIGLSIAGLILLSIAGWLGGELVFRFGIGVDPVGKIKQQT